MNIDSAKRTMPSLQSFQCGRLYGYQRVFSLVSVAGLNNGCVFPHVAALAIRGAAPEAFVLGCVFEIPAEELEGYLRREARYRTIEVDVEIEDGKNKLTVKAWTVIEQTDEDYRERLVEENKSYETEVGQYYDGQLWGRTDILPQTGYLSLCIDAAASLGHGQDHVRRNLLQEGFLADGVTTIGTYASTLFSKY